MLKTNVVNFYIDLYPKVLSFFEITQSKSPGNYWQNISENNKKKKDFCDPHKSRRMKYENGHARYTLMKDRVISY